MAEQQPGLEAVSYSTLEKHDAPQHPHLQQRIYTEQQGYAEQQHAFPEAYNRTSVLHDSNTRQVEQQPTRQAVICGIPRKKFCLLALIAVALIIIAAVVGGVVGATQGSKAKTPPPPSQTTDPSQATKASSSTSPSGSLTSATRTTLSSAAKTSTEISPTQTLYRDCPSSNDTIYDALSSPTFQFRKTCSGAYKWVKQAVVNKPAASLNDCVDLCASHNKNSAADINTGNASLCNAVCWRNSIHDPDWPGQCFGGTIVNTTDNQLPITDEVICDSAAWINQYS